MSEVLDCDCGGTAWPEENCQAIFRCVKCNKVGLRTDFRFWEKTQ